MEIYSSTTRFALACNTSSKVCVWVIWAVWRYMICVPRLLHMLPGCGDGLQSLPSLFNSSTSKGPLVAPSFLL